MFDTSPNSTTSGNNHDTTQRVARERDEFFGTSPMRRHRVFWRQEGGFTLVEILATIIILSIVLAIATSTWLRVVESRSVESDATQLVADMRLAHSRSSNQLADYQVVLNEGSSTYSVGPTGALASQQLENESVVDTTVTLTFKPNGTVEPIGPPVTFDVTSSRGNLSHEVEVIPATARVQIDP